MTSDLHRSDSAASWASENGAAPDDTAELLPLIDDGEIRDVEAAFSDMIDRTCSNGPAADGNIFEHTLVPGDWCSFIFRSMVPSHETVKQHFRHELPQQFFNYDGSEGVKYAFKVLDRRTNRLTYEQMPSYHKYGMRLLFSGPVQREILHTRAIQKFFARETRRIGEAFDDAKSRKHIPAFVKMYQIDLNQLLLTRIDEYASFNEFFYRKLKPDARPIASPDDPNIVVSAADCRLMVFDNINDATRIWIKGHHFSLARLFDDEKMAQEFDGGSIAVFRLAPVDYHRYHSPVNAKIGPKMKKITGTYYTVNPIAIKENLDVLTRNQRTVITLESDSFENVAFVSIGALLVGSVNFTVQPHEDVRKGDEVGYFAYGGSTIVVVFRAGLVKWDDDVQHNSNNSMETLVRMGERIGQRRTSEERQEYLEYFAKHGGRNSTIKQLLNYFPNVLKAT